MTEDQKIVQKDVDPAADQIIDHRKLGDADAPIAGGDIGGDDLKEKAVAVDAVVGDGVFQDLALAANKGHDRACAQNRN